MRYDPKRDRFVGHDFPWVAGNGFPQWELDELELGARVVLELDDPDGDQWWWSLQFAFNREQLIRDGILPPDEGAV